MRGESFKTIKNWERHDAKGFSLRNQMCLVGFLQFDSDSCLLCRSLYPDAEHVRSQHRDGIKCLTEGARCGEEFYRPDHLTQHLKNTHKVSVREHEKLKSRATFESGILLPTWCGFCCQNIDDRSKRFQHIGDHFVRDKKCMNEWIENVVTSK